MKNKVFSILILLCCGCSNYNTIIQLKKVKHKIANGRWETSYKVNNTDSLKKSYSVFEGCHIDNKQLLCVEEYDGIKGNFRIIYFIYDNGKIVKFDLHSQIPQEVYLGKDYMYIFYKDEKGEEAFAKYIKRK